MSAPVLWVDAFSDAPFAGNPAAVVILEGPSPETAMQSLAFELGLSETAYVWPCQDGFSLRWFTPSTEVDLCGHATLAARHALTVWGRAGADEAVRFQTRSGVLTASVRGELIELDLPAEVPRVVAVPPSLAAWPAIAAAEGRFDLLVELQGIDDVRAVRPAAAELQHLGYRGIVVTAAPAHEREPAPAPEPDPAHDYVLRFFAPGVGVDEDPVTGSAQCLLGPYWAARLGRTSLRAAQLSARGGRIAVVVDGDRVRIDGRAVTVLEGEVTGEAARRLRGG